MIPCPALWEDREEILALLGVATFQVLGECYHVSPQSSLLQAKLAQFFQSLLIGLCLQTPDHPRCSPLNSLQLVCIFYEVWCPELDAILSGMWLQKKSKCYFGLH